MSNPNHERAKEVEHAALTGLGLVGWLTTSQLGAWVWLDSEPDVQRALAQRLTKRLERRGLVKRRELRTGIAAWVLTRTGAAVASGASRWAFHHGYDLGLLDTLRQERAVAYLTQQRKNGKAAIGAAGIRAGVCDTANLTGLDGVVIDPDTGTRYGVLVIRSAHPETVENARQMERRVKLELVGEKGLVREYRKHGVG